MRDLDQISRFPAKTMDGVDIVTSEMTAMPDHFTTAAATTLGDSCFESFENPGNEDSGDDSFSYQATRQPRQKHSPMSRYCAPAGIQT